MSAWVGLCELALGGCTTTTDHLYVHPRGGGDLISAEIAAAQEVGLRFHPTRGSMSLGEKDGGCRRTAWSRTTTRSWPTRPAWWSSIADRARGAMVRVGLAPCSPFSVTPELMVRTAELAEQLDVRLHTHLAEDADEDEFCLARFGCRPIEHFEQVGWGLTAPGWPIACSPTRERSHGSVPGGPGWRTALPPAS